jgi:PPOX class probable F420-dependent enzyme
MGHVGSSHERDIQTSRARVKLAMTDDEAIARAAAARVGRIATVRPDGTPHVVPFVFALVVVDAQIRLYWVVDRKPKSSNALQRLENLRANPAVEVVVDEYDEDWGRLWWVRSRGVGRIVSSDRERTGALETLAAKYPRYAEEPPDGDVVAIDVRSITSWEASTKRTSM